MLVKSPADDRGIDTGPRRPKQLAGNDDALAAEKMDVDQIDMEMIKDNIYSSYFLPPDLIVKTGTGRRLHGFLLWDSSTSVIYFSNVLWNEMKEKDFIKAIKYYQDVKNRV